MPADDREVFDHFQRTATTPEIAGLAYAAYAFDKFEWINHETSRNGSEPTLDDVDLWIAGLPSSRFTNILVQAEDVFERAARAYLEDDIEQAVTRAAKRAVNSEIKRSNREVWKRVRRSTSFWRNLPGNLAVGLLSSIIFVVVVLVGAYIFDKDPSPFAMIKKDLHQTEQSSGPVPR